MKRVGIIGGGPGGLMSAYFLEKLCDSPLEITLFELSDRLGGKITTPCFKNFPLQYEAGAAEFYDYAHFGEDPLKELIAELGLSISPMGGSAVIMNGQILTNAEDIREHLGYTAHQELRAFDLRARNIMIPDEFYHSDHPEGSPDQANNYPFSDLLSEIQNEATQKYVQTLIHSDLATEPSLTNVAYGLQNYLMNDADYMLLYGIVGGNEQLPRELAARIHAQLKMQHRVNRIGKIGQQYLIESEFEGQVSEELFDTVIVALPHNKIPSIVFEGDCLSEAVQKHHQQYHFPAHYLRITILFEKPFWQSKLSDSFWMLDQFGGCCLYDESMRQPGGEHGILGWLLGGDAALEMSEWDDERLIQAALDSLPEFLQDGRSNFLEGAVHRWPASVNGMPGGGVQWNHDRRHLPEPVNHPHLFFVGDYLFDSTLNGVLDSAHYVASWIATLLHEYHLNSTA
ncbi:flavin monoamine oxidase family protein [Rubinisphaera italica]|nr:FAD-dependent oxidoreductase [Rubinisphaera italica]